MRRLSALLLLLPGLAIAQTPNAPSDDKTSAATTPPPPPPPPAEVRSSTPQTHMTETATPADLTLGGYVETYYQWNFNRPANNITNFRGFDNRHNSFTLSNAVLDAEGHYGPVSAYIAVQYGHTADTYYAGETSQPGSSYQGLTGANASSFQLWKYLQQAFVGWHAPITKQGLHIEAGLFLTPIGPEGMPIKDQWNWSRSNLFFGLPFYHAGLRFTYAFNDRLTATLHLYNGINTVVDNNAEKSIAGQVTYTIPNTAIINFTYYTGDERPDDAPEAVGIPGTPASDSVTPWRHIFDLWAVWHVLPWMSVLGHANAGFETNWFGTDSWGAGALYARFHPPPVPWLYLVVRGDFFDERVPHRGGCLASPIYWPLPTGTAQTSGTCNALYSTLPTQSSTWVSSLTLTAEARPHDNLSIRLEYRHDQAAAKMYFTDSDKSVKDALGVVSYPSPSGTSQDTLTLGLTAWF